MPGRNFDSQEYRYGFNGKEKDDEIKGEGLQYDYGFRVYDPRIGRFSSIDPMEGEYPSLSPYSYAANNPIMLIDKYGGNPEPPLTGWTGVTRQMFIKLVYANGFEIRQRPNESRDDYRRRFNTTLGKVFEKNVLNILGLKANTKRIFPYKFNNQFTVPDAIEATRFNQISDEKLFGVFNQVEYALDFEDALFFEAKFTKNVLFEQKFNPWQFKKQIDALANVNTATKREGSMFNRKVTEVKAKATEYGAAVLAIIVPSDAVIDEKLIEYATEKGVLLIRHNLEFKEDGDDTLGDFQGKIRLSKGESLNPEVIQKATKDKNNDRSRGDRIIGTPKDVIID
ncbi:RHS repeat domain-containing protein [Flagellimonas onchidii]|uniref:RHS repeat domain-containing protein n=1 Tax=Flagellimonas onchidii TaxID=2562684 RepID=UPI0010A6084B|nr:RHS repeat-associated core domain-containing protein [Allomuricauda onchidii]